MGEETPDISNGREGIPALRMRGVSSETETKRFLILTNSKAKTQRRIHVGCRNGILAVFLTLANFHNVMAQNNEHAQFPFRSDTLLVVGKGPFLIRPFLIEGTVRASVDSVIVSETEYSIDHRSGYILFPEMESERTFRLTVSYSYLPIEVATRVRLWPLGVLNAKNDADRARAPLQDLARSGTQFSRNRVQSSGSITRGVSTGSGQSVGIESGLRVQVNGEIVDGLFLRAALTDENTPLLPEGTTRRLNEFDRVFIELQSASGTVQLGDFDARINGGRFGQLSRKQQGVAASGDFGGSTGILRRGSMRLSGSVSKGIFRSQTVRPIDRVQGPYRLEGKNGEQFVIVIPGSEAIYLNGIRLVRGESNDYIIDYETGEITFTPRQIIGAESRVIAEFEYTTSQFTRTLLAADGNSTFGRNENGADVLSIGATVLREADGKEFNDEFGLTADDIRQIEEAGDGYAFKSGAVPVAYDPEATYTHYLKSSWPLSDSTAIDIFVALDDSPPAGETVYRVSFTRIGAGLGSYMRKGLSTNGIAYEYAGSGKGDYEPVQLLPSPILQQLIDFRSRFQPVQALQFSGEWAASINDLNRISGLNNDDNSGTAYEIRGAVIPVGITIRTASLGRVSGSLTRRYRSESFRTFSRTRPVEFARDWNIRDRIIDPTGGITGANREVENEGRLRLEWSDSSAFTVGVSSLTLGNTFEGTRATGSLGVSRSAATGIFFNAQYIDTIDKQVNQSGTWMRQQGRFAYGLLNDRLRPFVAIEHENLEQRDLENNALLSPSTTFIESRAGIAYTETRFGVTTEVKQRREDVVVEPDIRQPYNAFTLTSSGSYDPSRLLHVGATVGFRNTTGTVLSNSAGGAESPNSSLLIGLNGRWRIPTNGLNVNWFYQAQSERSTVLQEIYIRTGQDRGQFIWIDANNDTVMQLEEFIPETTPDEGLYVRSFLPSDSFEEITSAKARVRVEYRGSDTAISSTSSGLSGFLAGIGSVTLVDVEERSRDSDRLNLYLLRLDTFRSLSNTLNGRVRVRQELSMLRNHPRASMDLAVQEAQSLSELAAGKESVLNRIFQINGRYLFTEHVTIGFAGDLSRNRAQSESFSSRNFDILLRRIDPSVLVTVRNGLSLTLNSTVSWKRDDQSILKSTIIQIPVQIRSQIRQKLDLLARIEFANVDINGEPYGILGYEMTEGRGPGRSTLWRLTIQSNLTQVLTATASYDGRNPSNAKTVHTARFQLSARF